MSSQSNWCGTDRRAGDRPFTGLAQAAGSVGAESGADQARGYCSPRSELLAFKVGIVDSEADLLRVQALRQEAYGHHLPGLAANFGKPDPVDRWPDVTIFFAEDKASGRMVGSARLQCNRRAPLQIERSIELPAQFRGKMLGEVTRLTVIAGYAHPVKITLVKSLQLYCIAMQVSALVAASRPSLMRQYAALGFKDLYGDNRLAPMAHGGGLDHRVLCRPTYAGDEKSRDEDHPLYDFVFGTFHPDIEIFKATALVPEPLRDKPLSPAYSRAA